MNTAPGFSTHFLVFANLMKHPSLCLIHDKKDYTSIKRLKYPQKQLLLKEHGFKMLSCYEGKACNCKGKSLLPSNLASFQG